MVVGHQRPVRIEVHEEEKKFAVIHAQSAWQIMMKLRLNSLELGKTDLVHRHPDKTRLVFVGQRMGLRKKALRERGGCGRRGSQRTR